MKKLVSICFFSIMFLVLSVQAQDCCPFRLNNPHGDTLTGIANVPGGTLTADHRLNTWAVPGRTDVYDMVFSDADCLGIDFETGKVSIEWELWCDNVLVTDNLSDYCSISFQTRYNELQWIGGAVSEGTPTRQDYPGAIQQYQGTYNISNISFDYFYFKFLANTQNRIVITWNQAIRDVMLVVRVRERLNGTNNELYWNEGQNLNLGGHQSMPGDILAADTMITGDFYRGERTISSCEPVTKGKPAFTMEETGDYKIVWYTTDCITLIDSIITYHFTLYDKPSTPEVADQIYCQFDNADTIRLPNDTVTTLQDHVNQIVAYWSVDGGGTYQEYEYFLPSTQTVGTKTIYVKRHDKVTGCESEASSFDVIINELPDAPVVPASDRTTNYCVGSEAVALSYTAPEGMQVLWGKTSDTITSLVAPTPTTTAAGTQVYYLKLQNKETECISLGYDSMKVEVFANPVVTITSDKDTLCQGDQAELKAQPTNLTSYQWTIDDVAASTDTAITYTNNKSSDGKVNFKVEVTEAHGTATCKSTSDKYTIYAYMTIGAPAAVRGDTSLCGPGTITRTVLNPRNATTAVWYNTKSENAVELGRGTSYTAEFNTTTTVYVASQNDFGCETPVDDWISITVTVNKIPQIELTAENEGEVCAENELKITSTVTDGKTPIDYSWSGNGVQEPTSKSFVYFKNDEAGSYPVVLSVKDDNGCTNKDTIDIIVDSLPVIVKDVDYVISDNEYCVGTNASIEFTTDYTAYSINEPAVWGTSKTFSSLAEGTYYLRVKNSKGCVSHANTETIQQDTTALTLTTTNEGNTHCDAPWDGKLIAHVSPLEETFTYKLNDLAAQSDSTFTALQDRNDYTVYVEGNTTHCKALATNQVVADNKPNIVVDADIEPNTFCSGSNGKITVKVTPVADYTYALSGKKVVAAQVDSVFDELDSGTYVVTVYDAATKCEQSQSFYVSDSRATVTLSLASNHDNTHCQKPFDGNITVLSVSPESEDGYTYRYISTTLGYNASTDSTHIDTLEHGTYTVTAIDKVTYCEGSSDIVVEYAETLPTATIIAQDNYCYGDTGSVSLKTEGSVKFKEWTYSGPSASDTKLINSIKYQQKFSIKKFTAGDHVFTAQFEDTITHCKNTVSDTVRVIPVNITLTAVKPAVCFGDSTVVFCTYFPDKPEADTLVSYYWYSSSSWHYVAPNVYDSVIVTPNSDGSRVTIDVTDNHGCTNSKFIDITINELPNIELATSTGGQTYKDYCEGENTDILATTSHSSSSYVWTKGGTTVSTSASLVIAVGTADFDLNIEITDNNGCKNDSTFNVNVITKPGAPDFDPATQYFCDNESIDVDTTQQTTPPYEPVPGQYFVWNTTSPNVVKLPGEYTAHWSVTENGVTCSSADETVEVIVKKASFTAKITYNSESTPSLSATRCYDDDPSDKIYVDVEPNPSISTNRYTMWKNGVKVYDSVGTWHEDFEMDITRDTAGTYKDTIIIKLAQTKPDGKICYAYDTIIYTLTINPLPTEPTHFPSTTVEDIPTIFYCEGSTPNYTFATEGCTVKYSTWLYELVNQWFDDPVMTWISVTNRVKVIDNTTGCENIFKYQVIQVDTAESVTVTTSVSKEYCGSETVTGDFYAVVAPSSVDDKSYAYIKFNWQDGFREITRSNRRDTLSSVTFDHDTTISVSAYVTAGGTDYYAISCGPVTGSIDIVFQTPPTKPELSTSVAGYVSEDTVGYCANGDVSSPISVNITASDFTTIPSTGVTIKVVGGSFPITTEGVYEVYAQNDTTPYCTSDTLTLTVVKYRELSEPNNFEEDIYYCSTSSATVPFTVADTRDSLAYYSKPSTYLSTAPTTAGSYYVKVVDKEHTQCFLDKDFDITSVTNPTLTVSITDSLRKLCSDVEVGDVTAEPSFDTEEDSTTVTYYWNNSLVEGNKTEHFGMISGDSIITVKAIATNTSYGQSCESSAAYDQISVKYFAKPDGPSYVADKDFCAGDTVIVQTSSFTPSYASGISLSLTVNGTPDTLPYYLTDTKNLTVYAYYDSLSTCKSADSLYTITKRELPTVEISGTSPICYNDSTTLTASGAVSYVWSNGDTLATTKVPAGFYEVTGTDAYQCSNTDTMTVKSWDKFTVTMTDDTVICKDNIVTMVAVPSPLGTYTYAWYKDGESIDSTTQSITVLCDTMSKREHGLAVPYVYSVDVTDEHGCVSPADSNTVNITVDNSPYFTFTPSRDLTARVGESTNFKMKIDQNCWDPYEEVYIDFQFYKDGVPMSKEQLSQCLNNLEGTGINAYNTKYVVDILHNASLLSHLTAKSLNYANASDYLPHSEFITGTEFTYHWFYLHFLNNRDIDVTFGNWAQPGNYTVTYTVIRADIFKADGDVILTPYEPGMYIGGSGGHYSPKDTIAFDRVTIVVDGGSADDAPTSIATLEENKEDMNMTVYPNPADNNVNVVLNGVQGQTVITIHDMSGKAISSRRVNVDFDGQLYNLPVEGYAQGIYFIKVVNGDAVMTKKLIIAR